MPSPTQLEGLESNLSSYPLSSIRGLTFSLLLGWIFRLHLFGKSSWVSIKPPKVKLFAGGSLQQPRKRLDTRGLSTYLRQQQPSHCWKTNIGEVASEAQELALKENTGQLVQVGWLRVLSIGTISWLRSQPSGSLAL